ncbi:MAG: choloylglycine hydrolase [Candidatus Coproplasma sp.]
MCTAVYLNKGADKGGVYFGRTLDYDFSYGEEVVITPRSFPFNFKGMGECANHFAFIGTAKVLDNFPLYYDAMNERGLYIAGLNFVGNACYAECGNGKKEIAQFELIPYLMCKCASVDGVIFELGNAVITGTPFDKQMPTAQLHWLIADKDRCITVECVKEGLKIYENPVGVLTNNPPFDYQLFNLNNYRNVTAAERNADFGGGVQLNAYSRGMGGMGLPGDWSSQSRFVRAAFACANSTATEGEQDGVMQFFHVLNTVFQPSGICHVGKGQEKTIYSSCISPQTGRYYYSTYESFGICAVEFEDKDREELIRYPHKAVGETVVNAKK